MDNEIQKRFEAVSRSKTFNRIVRVFGLENKKVLDIGCGYGEHMVHFGHGSAGISTTLEEIEYAKTKGLDVRRGNAEFIDELGLGSDFSAIWANNFLEHILSPHAFLIKLKKCVQKDALIILGVPVIPGISFLTGLSKFRGALAGSHINFFTVRTLRLTAERAGWKVLGIRSFVFGRGFLDKLFGIVSPHVYVVARNDPAFKYSEKKKKEWENDGYYKKLLLAVGYKPDNYQK